MGRSTVMDDDTPQLPGGQPDAEEPDASQRDPALWHFQQSNSLALVRLALLRMRHGWRLLATTGIGMLVAITLICMVPLYSTLIANAQLRHTLAAAPPSQVNVATFVSSDLLSPGTFPFFNQSVETIRQRELGAFAPHDAVSLRAIRALSIDALNGQDTATARPDLWADAAQLYAYDYTQALPHMQLFAGRLPQEVSSKEPAEVLATPQLNVHIGDVFTLSSSVGGQMNVRVVGIWFPKQNVTDPFWNGVNFDTVAHSLNGPQFTPLLFAQSALLGAIANSTYSDHRIQVVYLSFTQPTAFDTSNMQLFYDQIQRYRREIGDKYNVNLNLVHDASVGTALDTLIQQVQAQQSLLQLPLASVVALLVGLALLFVFLMASIVIERQGSELATLTSRGASRAQLLGSFTLQSVLLALLLAPLGLLLATTLALLLARLFIPSAAAMLSGALVLRVMPLPAMLLLGLAGVLLSSLAVLLAVWHATRLDVLAFRRAQGRGDGAPLWQRLNLDVLLSIVCVAGYLELGQFGSLNVRAQLVQVGLADSQSQSAQSGADPLLLLTPALLLLAGGLLVLRLFPLAARIGAWLVTRARGAAGMLAFAHIARVTAQFSRLALLLTLAVALGIFALGFDSSLAVNAAQQAAYDTGGDVRITLNSIGSASAFATPLGATYAQLPGVTAVTPVYRTVAKVTTSELGQNVATLGIDPASFGRVAQASWRADDADQSLARLLTQLQAHAIATTTTGTAATGQQAQPIWAIIDDTTSATLHLAPGDHFSATPNESRLDPIAFVVGAVVHHFPTLYSSNAHDHTTGFVIANQQDLLAALRQIGGSSVFGPTEYWLRTTGAANSGDRTATNQREQLLRTNADLYAATITDRRTLTARALSDPLNAGMGGLLLVGAALAALLAVLGCLVQSSVSARQRVTLFAILRTLGMTRRQLRALLLSEQSVVYLFGACAGSLLGVALATATLPFLQFSNAVQDPTALGAPVDMLLSFDGNQLALFYTALLGTFLAALVVGAWVALRAGIGTALRIGED